MRNNNPDYQGIFLFIAIKFCHSAILKSAITFTYYRRLYKPLNNHLMYVSDIIKDTYFKKIVRIQDDYHRYAVKEDPPLRTSYTNI